MNDRIGEKDFKIIEGGVPPEGETAPDPIGCPRCEKDQEWVWAAGKWREPMIPCESCQEIIAGEEDDKRRLELEKKKRLKREKNIEKILLESGVPRKLSKCSFDSFERLDSVRKEILKDAEDYVRGFTDGFGSKPSLFISGPNGTGKTHLAVAIMREAILAGWDARFENFPRILLSIKGSWNRSEVGPSESEIINRLARAPFAVLDDLGREVQGEWVRMTAYLLINERELQGFPFIITSELGLNEIASIYDRAIADRIAGECELIIIGKKTPSYRRRKP